MIGVKDSLTSAPRHNVKLARLVRQSERLFKENNSITFQVYNHAYVYMTLTM